MLKISRRPQWYSIVYNYNGAQCHKHFLHVGRLYWALILLGLGLDLPSASAFFGLHGAMYIENFWLDPFPYVLVS